MNRITIFFAPLLLVLAAVNPVWSDDTWRTWTSADGTYSVEAQFIKLEGDTVELQRKDGRVIKVPIDKLSRSDVTFVREQAGATRPNQDSGATPGGPPERDARDKFGTRSAAAARALSAGIELVQQGRPTDALPALKRAIRADPDLQLAIFWLALAQIDLGDVDEGLQSFEDVVEVAKRTSVTNITIDSCINAGLTLAKLKEEKRAAIWFTRSVLLDPQDRHKLRWKAYRNMAISHHLQGKNLAAALCAAFGYTASSKNVELSMVEDFLNRAEGDEVAQVLRFGNDELPKVERREMNTSLEKVAIDGIPKEVYQLLADNPNNRMVTIIRNENAYYVVECADALNVRSVEVSGSIAAGCAIGGNLYLSVVGKGIVQVDPLTGQEIRSWPLAEGAPTSLAVLPRKQVAIFPKSNILTTLDLETGRIFKSDFYAHAVVADPQQRFCYTYVRKDSRPTNVGHLIVNGRPIFLHRTHFDWSQTALFKYAIADKQPVLVAVRMNAASNGRVLHVSNGGRWVGIAGGGGWRPTSNGGHGAGYGVAVFAADAFEHIQGFYGTDAYPKTLAVNAITGQVAAVREKDAKIHHLVDAHNPTVIEGPHGSVAGWSPDGKYLFIAGPQGLQAWQNKLSAAEDKTSAQWLAQTKVAAAEATVAAPSASPAVDESIEEYGSFAISNDRDAIVRVIELATKSGRNKRALAWLSFGPYQEDPDLRRQFLALGKHNEIGRENAGIHIYQLRKLKKQHPPHPGLDFLLGMSYFVSGQLPAAESAHLAAIRMDRARTNISTESLRCLAAIKTREKDDLAAAFCFAHLLRLDRANATRLAEAKTVFAEADLEKVAADLLKLGAQEAAPIHPSAEADVDLPNLPRPKTVPRRTSEQIFSAAAPSVVLIQTRSGNGTGVCVGQPGVILTNAHVIGCSPRQLKVIPFRINRGQVERLAAVPAKVIYCSEQQDVAVLRLAAAGDIEPLYVSDTAPRSGANVYALGNPGLGDDVLDVSITEGILSATDRQFAGKTFLQHTAPVNPGNSGGPLLDEYGQVVGIVTLKAKLEGVSFAIPAERIRQVFGPPASE